MLRPTKSVYQRNLPHFVPPGAILFITFRLAGSLPPEVLACLEEKHQLTEHTLRQQELFPKEAQQCFMRLRKQYFARFDSALDTATTGPLWLREAAVAKLVSAEIYLLKELDVAVICYCIMANHVHLVVQLPETSGFSYAKMMQRLKGRTALAVNRLLGRTGQPLWQQESYDYVVRSGGELARVVAYVLENPVKARLVEEWQQWPYSYWNDM